MECNKNRNESTCKRVRVLLVDDEEGFLDVTARRLRKRGFEIETVTSGAKALELLNEQNFDVVVLDLAMPGIDGIETLKRIKSIDPDLQAIMLTGHATVEISVEAMKIGAGDFLQKPADTEKLIEKIQAAKEVTRQKILERRMAQTEKLASLGTLAAGVAHELNNPLTVILGMTDLLLEKVAKDTELLEILKTIERQGTNAKRIVENLVTFARHAEHKRERVSINNIIYEVLDVAGKTLLMNKIEIKFHLEPKLPCVTGSYGELQQVVFNIITNAMYEMKDGGKLRIATALVNREKLIEIRISDTGPGIAKKTRNRIFDPFFTTKKVGEGTGLGLSISHSLVKKHGGSIIFETTTKEESEQTGTTFIISLPVEDHHDAETGVEIYNG